MSCPVQASRAIYRSMKRTGRSQSPSPPSANARIVVLPMEKTENEATSAAAPPPPLRRGDFLVRVKQEPEKEPEKERGDFLEKELSLIHI